MPSRSLFKCLHCNQLHNSDARNRGRQHYCVKPDCRKASKAASQKRWRAKPQNQDYFRGSDDVERVRRWRAAHPGYWRKTKSVQQDALQEICIEQIVVDKEDAIKKPGVALQDVFTAQPTLMVGLISVLTGHALQEDIVASARIFQSRGEDILRMGRAVSPTAENENQAHFVCAATAAGAASVQLD